MDPVPLDKDLAARFKDKTMAIVGYETDQVVACKKLNAFFCSNDLNIFICRALISLLHTLFPNSVGYENKRRRQIRSNHVGL